MAEETSMRKRSSNVEFVDAEEGSHSTIDLGRSPLSPRRRWQTKKCICLVLGVALIALVTWYYKKDRHKTTDSRETLVYYSNQPNLYGIKPRVTYDKEKMIESVRMMKMGEKDVVMPKREVKCVFSTPSGERTRVLSEGESIRTDFGPDCIQCTQCTINGMNCTISRNTKCQGH